MSSTTLRRVAGAAFLLAAASASAYTFNGRTSGPNDGRLEWPLGAMTWRFNNATSDALSNIVDGSDPRGAIIAAFAKWEAESGFDFTQGADSAATEAGDDGVNLITFANTAENVDDVGPALAVCIFGFDFSNNITRADIIFGPLTTWTTLAGTGPEVPIAGVALHEIGHLTGLAHSAVVGSTMYPFAGANSAPGNSELIPASVSPDDRAGINLSYPDPIFSAATGRITGLVTEGGSNVFGAHVVAVNTSTGVVMGANITLGSGQASGRHGRYEIAGLPPGTYQVYVEPINSPIGFGNWQTFYTNGWFTTGANGGQSFDSTFLTKIGSAGTVVTAGGSATVDIAVTNGTPAVNISAFGIGSPNCSGGGGFTGLGGLPVSVTAGGTRDFSLQGTGLTVDTTIAVSDPNITINVACQGFRPEFTPPVMLFRTTVPANARPGPRTIWVTLPGGEIAACTGCLEIEGPETEAGLCDDGIDNDGDGLTDSADIECFVDNCPDDPLKTSPGQCGCGNPDTDTDGDGTANCIDGCPLDPAKIAAGQCGCGTLDTDTDGDGTANCNDGCPNDPAKTAPGTCGCGNSEADSDGDGTKDCNDGCPADPAKTAPGTCGCGVSEADSDGDGTKDCNDGCPADPAKTAPGTCGCGIAETDTDGDGVKDCVDNCPDTPNADQADVNGNGTGDACEALALRLETVSATFGQMDVGMRLFVEADAGLCLSHVRARVGFDGSAVAVTSIEPVAGCDAEFTPDGPDAVDIGLECDPGFEGEGILATLRLTAPDGPTEVRHEVTLSMAEADDCDAPPNTLAAPATFDGALIAGCILGDVYRVGSSLGVINTADFIVSRRMALGTHPETATDRACGDVHPAVVTCEKPPGQASHLCVTGDEDIRTGDVIVLRRRLNLVYTFQCAACSTQLARDAGMRRAGDIAPGAGDGQVGVSDAVRALRLSVGLDVPDAETLLRGDVAPATREADGRLAVVGDGLITVGDVVLLLRTSVGLETIAWPEREIAVLLDTEAPSVGWRAQVSGWPDWAEATGFEGPGCDDFSGLDAAGSTWASVCALPLELVGPHGATWRYRAPERIDPALLTGDGESVDEALNTTLAPVILFSR